MRPFGRNVPEIACVYISPNTSGVMLCFFFQAEIENETLSHMAAT